MSKTNIKIETIPVAEFFAREDVWELFDAHTATEANPLIDEPIRPNVNKYIQLESLGVLDCIVLTDNVYIYGFMMLIHNEMLHYSKMSTVVESFYVDPDYRKYGSGKKMIDFAIGIGKIKGSCAIFLSAGVDKRLAKAAKGFGFKPTNTIYTKAF